MDNLQLTTANIVFGTKKQYGGRKTRSNKGVKRRPYGRRTGKTRSGKRFRPVAARRTVRRSRSTRSNNNRPVRRTRKQRSNKGVKRGPYGRRTGRTRSGRKFRGRN